MGSGVGTDADSSACRERHVVKMLPIALCAATCGGLAGGEAKSADCSRVSGGRDECDESQDKAEGSSMVAQIVKRELVPVLNGVYKIESRCVECVRLRRKLCPAFVLLAVC
jgi:hypothetical protein